MKRVGVRRLRVRLTTSLSEKLRFGMHPRLTVGAAQEPVRFVIALDNLLGRVPRQRAIQALRQVGEDAACGRNMAFFDVGDRTATLGDGVQEVSHVAADGGGDVAFQVLFVAVFGVFFEFHDDVAANAFPLADRREVVAVDAAFQGAAVAIDRGASGIIRVRRRAPGAMRPENLLVAEVERGGLRIRDVSAAIAID